MYNVKNINSNFTLIDLEIYIYADAECQNLFLHQFWDP